MRSVLVSCILALSACATVPAGEIRSDGQARLGEATRVGALVVTPRAVIEDSRCPVNARCVWAGRAIVRADVAGRNWRQTLDLTLGEPALLRGKALALTSIEPGKMAGAEPAPPQSLLFGFAGGR